MSAGMLGEAFIRVRAKMDGLKADLQAAQRQTESSLDRASQKMGAAGATLTRKATLPILAMGAGIAKSAGNFEAGMNKVEAISGAAGAQLGKLRDQAKDLGSTTQYSAGEAADAMSFLAMAGFDADDVMSAMPGTLQLAAAGQMDLAQAADIASNVLTGYGKEASELGHVNDVLAKTFTSTNTDLSMLGESMKYAAPVANSAGVAFEEAAAAVGLMGNAGIQGSMAGTALRGAISRMLKPSNEAAAVMDDLGMNVTDATGKLLPLEDIVRQLETSGADTAQMMALFGERAGPAMAALVDQGADSLGNLKGELENSGGTAKRIADAQMKGFNGAMKELKSALEGAAIAIAESGLLDFLTDLAKKLAGAFRWLSSQPPAVQKLVMGLLVFAAAIGPLLAVVGKMIAVFQTLKKVWLAVKVAFLVANPFVLIGLAIAALVILVIKHWDTIKKYLLAAWNWVKETAKKVWDAIASFFTDLWASITSAVKSAWTAVKDWLAGVWDGIKAAAVAVFDALKAYFTAVLNGYKAVFTAVWDGIKAYFTSVLRGLKAVFTTVWDAVTGIARTVWDTISGIFRDALGALRALLSGDLDTFVQFFRDLPGRILSALGNIGSLLLDAGKSLVSGFIDGIKAMFGKVKSTLGGLTRKLTSWKGPPRKDKVLLRPAGRSIIGSLVDGFGDRESAVRRKLQALTDTIAGGVDPTMPSAGFGGRGGAEAYAGGGAARGGPLMHVENLHVRDDRDIDRLSARLHSEHRNTLRAFGEEGA